MCVCVVVVTTIDTHRERENRDQREHMGDDSRRVIQFVVFKYTGF